MNSTLIVSRQINENLHVLHGIHVKSYFHYILLTKLTGSFDWVLIGISNIAIDMISIPL